MLITDEIFRAFLNCETKAHLKFLGEVGPQREHVELKRSCFDDFKQECLAKLRADFGESNCLVGASSLQTLGGSKRCLLIDCVLQSQGLQSHVHTLERSAVPINGKSDSFIPIRCVLNNRITEHDKLLLAFGALVLSTISGEMPLFGKIVYGCEQRVVKAQLASLVEKAQAKVSEIAAQQEKSTHPQLILNKHCPECEFQPRCRQIAMEKDDLTLLPGMSEKERRKQNDRGIFTVTQLSYTYRPRRRPKRLASKLAKYSHALKALAIREGKVHVTGKPKLNIEGTPVFLDVEGIPDQDFYYLIGLRIKSDDSYVQHSFWANERSDEREIWASFLGTLADVNNPRLVHYGSYEAVFLKRMKERYPEVAENATFLDRLITESVNLVSVIYAQIYFPTYSNGLKEIAQYLGFRWSDNAASGLSALMWRSKWEFSGDATHKQKILAYNAEDCEALERVTNVVVHLCERQTGALISPGNAVVHADTLKQEWPYLFRRIDFSVPELDYINQAAYWHYQRDKIYVRSSQRLKRIRRESVRAHTKPLPVNRTVKVEGRPRFCPKCKATKIYKWGQMTKVVNDLKLSPTGIKRWIVEYIFNRYICWECRASFYLEERPWTRSKYGPGLRSYVIYQIIELRLAQRVVAQSLNQLFGFHLRVGTIARLKDVSADLYEATYEAILDRLISGKLLHADETKINLVGKEGFVWVLTNLEEVAYFYTDTREIDPLQSLLQDFRGVLVSDFYAAYDAIDCPQQKCLIHLIRDLNEDLRKQPFNEELSELVRDFAMLLKPMIETVDRFGLKSYFLRKHKISVKRFYKNLSKRNYESELAVKYKKRIDKNRDKLFTFLDYDGVPWNNNNAEHAIKAFVRLRNVLGGTSSDKGIREYLVLLSLCETCKYKGVNFLDFLQSGETDIDVFIKN
jgi:predicted RecB family nuclease